MQLSAVEAEIVSGYFGLSPDEGKWLQTVPYRGANQSAATPSSDPLLYRFYEVIFVRSERPPFGPITIDIVHFHMIDDQCFWTGYERNHPR